MKLKTPIHVMTYREDLRILQQRRPMPPPNQIHKKKKGRGAYDRKQPEEIQLP